MDNGLFPFLAFMLSLWLCTTQSPTSICYIWECVALIIGLCFSLSTSCQCQGCVRGEFSKRNIWCQHAVWQAHSSSLPSPTTLCLYFCSLLNSFEHASLGTCFSSIISMRCLLNWLHFQCLPGYQKITIFKPNFLKIQAPRWVPSHFQWTSVFILIDAGEYISELVKNIYTCCYMHAMDLHFTLTSSIGFIFTNHTIRPPWPLATDHLLCSI